MPPRPPKTVVTLSGGIDSTTLLYYLRQQGHDLLAISIDYAQRHRVELQSAQRIAAHLGIPHEVADLRGLTRLWGSSSLTDAGVAVPLGHYEAQNMKSTVVPNRNMILLAVAAAWAIGQKADNIAYAAHAGDHAIYPDCRPQFADALAKAIHLADWRPIELLRPFVDKSKTDIVRLAHELGVPFAWTWSCYQGGAQHCGACGTCIERREAFLLANLPDPTIYEPQAPALRPPGTPTNPNAKLEIDWTHTITGDKMPLSHREWVGGNPAG